MMSKLDPQSVKAVQHFMATAMAKVKIWDQDRPKEITEGSHEDFPTMRRYNALMPQLADMDIPQLDLYYGSEYKNDLPEMLALPRDQRVLCLLSTKMVVFLSDDVTAHYAGVYNVNYATSTVTLADPWAEISFLLPGRNVLGIRARAYVGDSGGKFLDISFDDFVKVIHGSLQTTVPLVFTGTLETVYPELKNNNDYKFWKTTRLLEAVRFSRELDDYGDSTLIFTNDPSIDLSLYQDVRDMRTSPDRHLQLLAGYLDDVTAVSTGFTLAGFGKAAQSERSALQPVFLSRLAGYAHLLPWGLKWGLAEDAGYLAEAALPPDIDVHLGILDSFIASDPHDIDFRIARAALLLRMKRPEDALRQLDEADRHWSENLTAEIRAGSPQRALEIFNQSTFSLASLALFDLERAKIGLLRLTGRLMLQPGLDVSDAARQIATRYRGALLSSFFSQILTIDWLRRVPADEEGDISDQLAASTSDATEQDRVAGALYVHFTTRRSVKTLGAPIQQALKDWAGIPTLCHISDDERVLPNMSAAMTNDLADFCDGVQRPRDSRTLVELIERKGAAPPRANPEVPPPVTVLRPGEPAPRK